MKLFSKSWPNFEISTKFWNFNQMLEFQPNIGISTKFGDFNQISEYWPNFGFLPTFGIFTKFWNFNQISEFQPNFRISIKFQKLNQGYKFDQNVLIWTRFRLINDCACTNCKIIWKTPVKILSQLWSSSQASKPTD